MTLEQVGSNLSWNHWIQEYQEMNGAGKTTKTTQSIKMLSWKDQIGKVLCVDDTHFGTHPSWFEKSWEAVMIPRQVDSVASSSVMREHDLWWRKFLVFIRREWRIFSSVITTCFFFPNKRFQHFKQKYPQLVFFSKEFSSISWVTFRGFFFGMVLGPRQWSVFESFCFFEKDDGEDLRTITTAATIMYIIYCIHIYIYIYIIHI